MNFWRAAGSLLEDHVWTPAGSLLEKRVWTPAGSLLDHHGRTPAGAWRAAGTLLEDNVWTPAGTVLEDNVWTPAGTWLEDHVWTPAQVRLQQLVSKAYRGTMTSALDQNKARLGNIAAMPNAPQTHAARTRLGSSLIFLFRCSDMRAEFLSLHSRS